MSFIADLSDRMIGGTIWLTGSNRFDEEFWDGHKPFRITAANENSGNELKFNDLFVSDYVLENDEIPYDSLKIDHLKLTAYHSKEIIFARGNKLVIGEGVTTESNKEWRIYGGGKSTIEGHTVEPQDVLTNVVVARLYRLDQGHRRCEARAQKRRHDQ